MVHKVDLKPGVETNVQISLCNPTPHDMTVTLLPFVPEAYIAVLQKGKSIVLVMLSGVHFYHAFSLVGLYCHFFQFTLKQHKFITQVAKVFQSFHCVTASMFKAVSE